MKVVGKEAELILILTFTPSPLLMEEVGEGKEEEGPGGQDQTKTAILCSRPGPRPCKRN